MRSKQIRVINGPRNKRSTTVHIYMSMVTSISSLVQNKSPPRAISSLVLNGPTLISYLAQYDLPQSPHLEKIWPPNPSQIPSIDHL